MLIVACGESTMSRTQVQLWYNSFKEDGEDVSHRAPQQPKKTLKQWRKWFCIILESLLAEATDDVGISFGSCQAIFTYFLGMKRAAAKIVPKLLNFEQKPRHVDIA